MKEGLTAPGPQPRKDYRWASKGAEFREALATPLIVNQHFCIRERKGTRVQVHKLLWYFIKRRLALRQIHSVTGMRSEQRISLWPQAGPPCEVHLSLSPRVVKDCCSLTCSGGRHLLSPVQSSQLSQKKEFTGYMGGSKNMGNQEKRGSS